MINEPKVFIIILNYNSFEDTKECLISLDNVYYKNKEIVVVDNCSNDESYEKLLLEFNKYKIIKSTENNGYACGNNIGIKYALNMGTDYICLLNNDVVVERDFLSKVVSTLEKDRSIGIAGPCICSYADRNVIQAMGANINLYTGLTQGKCKGLKYKSIPKKDAYVDYLGGACFVCKKEVFERAGLIPENYFLFFEETEFCLRVARLGYKLICVYESKVYHKGSSTISKYNGLSYYLLNRNRVIFIRRNANYLQKAIFSVYIFIEALGRIILRREPKALIHNFICGFKGDINKVNMDEVNKLIL